jgi:hypothetical protein
VIVPIPTPALEHDILTTIEFWTFRIALLIVFLSWLVRHVIHEVKVLIPALRELRQIWKSPQHPEHPKVIPNSSP